MTHIEQRFYGTCTKKNLLWKANALLDELLEYFKEEIEKTGGLFL